MAARKRRFEPDSESQTTPPEPEPQQTSIPDAAPPRAQRSAPWAGERHLDTYQGVARSVVEVDVDDVFLGLERRLRVGSGAGKQISGQDLMTAIDRVQEDYIQASRLANKARREYELYKIAYESWLEEKKTAALVTLEDLKAQKKLTKQITDSMVTDAVMTTWPSEYTERIDRLKTFQAAVHQIESLQTAYSSRARSLGDLKELVLAFR